MKYIYHSIFFALILLLIFSCSNSSRLLNCSHASVNQHVNYSFQTGDHKSKTHSFADATASTSEISSNENTNDHLLKLSNNIQNKLSKNTIKPSQQKRFSQKKMSELFTGDSSLKKSSEIPFNVQRKTHWASVASLVTGFLAALTFAAFLFIPFTITVSTVIFWLSLGCILGLLAFSFGITGAKASGKDKKFKNKGLAIAGYVMGIAGMGLLILAALLSISSLF